MNTATRITTTMVVAFVAMIGMTGFAMANSTIDTFVGDGTYNMDFNGIGTGSLIINTHTSHGDDYQYTDWSNACITGDQFMMTGSSWTEIDRDTKVTGVVNGEMATGHIEVGTIDDKGDSLTELALYHDDNASGSYVDLGQNVWVGSSDSVPYVYNVESGVGALTTIKGYSYGADTQVAGQIQAVSSGQDNVSVSALVDMSNGKMSMVAGIGVATINGSHEGAALSTDMLYGNGTGMAVIDGRSTSLANASSELYVADDDFGYNLTGDLYGDPVNVNLYDDFDTDYNATGYIYVLN